MAINFGPEKAKFKDAIYGKDVRSALVSMAEKCQKLANEGGGGGGGDTPSLDEDLIARQFSTLSTVTYKKGDHVIYNNALWVARGSTTGGTFKVNMWKNTNVATEIESIDTSGGGGDVAAVEEMITHGFPIGSTYQYKPGDYVEYGDVLYKCISATTAKTFDASKWTQAWVSDELVAIKDGADAADTAGMIAPVFDPNTSYSVGDYVAYNGVLYICTKASSGAWSYRNWKATTVSSHLASGDSDASTVRQNVNILRNSIAYKASDDSWKAGEYAFSSASGFLLRRYLETYNPGDSRAYTKDVRLAQDLTDLRKTIAPEHDSSTVYPPGAVVYYDNKLYQRTASNSGVFKAPAQTGYDADGNPTYIYYGWEPVTMLNLVNDIIDGFLNLIVPEFDPNRENSYNVYDIVRYNKRLYICEEGTSVPPENPEEDEEHWGVAYNDGSLAAIISHALYWIDDLSKSTTEMDMIASFYSSDESYQPGDFVIYTSYDSTDRWSASTDLYKCITATTGDFDTSCWKKTKLAEELKSLL